ncbi:MAG: hypothetical protein ACLTDV_04730 [Eubacterium sp.]
MKKIFQKEFDMVYLCVVFVSVCQVRRRSRKWQRFPGNSPIWHS